MRATVMYQEDLPASTIMLVANISAIYHFNPTRNPSAFVSRATEVRD